LINSKGFGLYPPVKRGDLVELLDKGFIGRVVIADGVFHQVLSVGHREIINVIKRGCEVIGLSSMGAIRAFELRDYGMRGYGRVYRQFFEVEDFMDDEVALLFEPTPPYRTLSEPLVHFRECLNHLLSEGKVTNEAQETILDKLKELYFGERTIQLFEQLLRTHSDVPIGVISAFDRFRIKSLDLLNFLQEMDQE
jgi:hypothetical protein